MHASRVVVVAAAAALAAPLLLTSCIVPSPSPATNASLNAVAATSATNAWAVGVFHDRSGAHELLERWNGQSWREVFLPPPIGKSLTSITAVNADNVWAVSEIRTLHFGGLGWSSYPNPAAIAMQKVASAPDGSVYGLGSDSTFADSLWLMTLGAGAPSRPYRRTPRLRGVMYPKVHRPRSGQGGRRLGRQQWNANPQPAVHRRAALERDILAVNRNSADPGSFSRGRERPFR